jgi:transcription antitermination factor NusG
MKLGRRKVIIKPRQSPLDPARPFASFLQWFVITTSPLREYVVAHWLEEIIGAMTLCPLETRVKLMDNHRGGKFALRTFYQIPVFPRMVMVGFSSHPNWLQVMDHYHIAGVLGFNGTPEPMRKGEAERIRASSECLRTVKVAKPLEAGGKARIIAPGMFTGHVVEIASLHGKRGFVVQNWFNEKRIVEMQIDDLEAVA